jgi:uncharacterized protein (DUF302 family)
MKNTIIIALAATVIVLLFATILGSGNQATPDPDQPAAIDATVPPSVGIIATTSERTFVETTAAIREAIEGNENLTLLAAVDHAENAASADLELAPTMLFIFGNPAAGTPLMQSAQSAGLDLPQKLLVTESETGVVTIRYNDPRYVADRHGIGGQEQRLEAIAALLENLADSPSAEAEDSGE